MKDVNPLLEDIVICIWTRWSFQYRGVKTDDDREKVARTVVSTCWTFIRKALAGHAPKKVFFLKTPAPQVRPQDFQREAQTWRAAIEYLKAGNENCDTLFEFEYSPTKEPVCIPWFECWFRSRWWEAGTTLGFISMDFIDVLLPEEYQMTLSADLEDDEIRSELKNASTYFGELLRRTSSTKGLTLGGYRTYEHGVSRNDVARRGGIAAKDLLEAAFRCYASGVFRGYEPLETLLKQQSDLRLRSEIIGMHRECWERLEYRLSPAEPWEATTQLVLGALLEGCRVDQVNFQWLLEEGGKPDAVIVEQLRRGIHVIERLRHAWFNSIPLPNAT